MKRSIIQPTDDYLASLSVAQLMAIYRAHRPANDIDSVILLNRITCRLFDIVGEEEAEMLINGRTM